MNNKKLFLLKLKQQMEKNNDELDKMIKQLKEESNEINISGEVNPLMNMVKVIQIVTEQFLEAKLHQNIQLQEEIKQLYSTMLDNFDKYAEFFEKYDFVENKELLVDMIKYSDIDELLNDQNEFLQSLEEKAELYKDSQKGEKNFLEELKDEEKIDYFKKHIAKDYYKKFLEKEGEKNNEIEWAQSCKKEEEMEL
jgi:hypothetical protein